MSEEFTETYRWRLEDEAGQPLASEHSVPFPTQADAEAWFTESWQDLADAGVAQVSLLRSVAMPTGHAACTVEKRLHAQLRRRHPDAVVPPEHYQGILNVVSEIYRPWLRAELENQLDRIADAVRGGESSGTGTQESEGKGGARQDGGGEDGAAC